MTKKKEQFTVEYDGTIGGLSEALAKKLFRMQLGFFVIQQTIERMAGQRLPLDTVVQINNSPGAERNCEYFDALCAAIRRERPMPDPPELPTRPIEGDRMS